GDESAVDVVEEQDAGREPEILPVISAQLFGKQLLPSVTGFGIGRISVLLSQCSYIGVLLLALSVYAGGGRKKKFADLVRLAGLDHVGIDQDVVAGNVRMGCGNVSNAAHVSREVIHFIEAAASGEQARIRLAQIQNFKFIA